MFPFTKHYAQCHCGAEITTRSRRRLLRWSTDHGVNCTAGHDELQWLEVARQLKEVGAVDVRDVPSSWKVTR